MSNKKTPPIKIVRGGSTGLVQQNLKSYPTKPKKPKEEYVYIFIKDTIKKKYDVDLVIIMGGKYHYNAVDEDSELIHKKFGSKEIPLKPYAPLGKLPYNTSTFGVYYLHSMIKKFQKENIKYAVLDILPNTDPVMRKVTASSAPSSIGFEI